MGLLHLGVEEGGIDLGDGLSLFHRRIEIDEELLDGAGDLGADLHRDHRGEVAGGGDGRDDGTPFHFGGLEGGFLRRSAVDINPRGQGNGCDHGAMMTFLHSDLGTDVKLQRFMYITDKPSRRFTANVTVLMFSPERVFM